MTISHTSLINNAHAGSEINLTCMIYRILQNFDGKYSVDEMVELCRPSNLPIKSNHEKKFKDNLLFWMDDYRQLWVEKDDKLKLVEKLQKPIPSSIALAVHNALFKIELENIFTDTHKTEALFRALGCMLACDNYTLSSKKRFEGTGPSQSIDKMFDDNFPGVPGRPVNAEKPTVIKYGLFLGYLEPWPDNKYVVDPTRVVKNHLPKIFEKNAALDAKDFFRKLGKLLPLMEGGSYRRMITDKMTSNAPDFSKKYLTKSLSLSLYRLEKLGLIRTEGGKSDDLSAHVYNIPNEKKDAFSTVRYLRGRANS